MKLNNIGFIGIVHFISVFFISCTNEMDNKHEYSNEKLVVEETNVSDFHDSKNENLVRMNKIRDKLKRELGENYDEVIAEPTNEQIVHGAEVYNLKCAKCHGKQGKGDGVDGIGLRITLADLTNAEYATFYSDEARKRIIRKGIDGTTMIAWQTVLNEQEIDNVYLYIRTLIKTVDTE